MSNQTISSGSSANLTANGFSKSGWSFIGWATSAGGAVAYADGASYTMGASNVTLYAKWSANNYTITFDKNDGSATGSMSNQTIASGSSANLTANAYAKAGWSFIGWATTAGGTVAYADGSSYTMGASNVTLYAKWRDYREIVSIIGGTYIQTDGGSSFSHTISSFFMGKYQVTYELWYAVRQWAISNGYTFANAGIEGNWGTDGALPTAAKFQPVTTVSWRDCIVWCNAYSQMSLLTPCYTYSSVVIKDSRDSNPTACDNAVCNWSANGYRLPSEGEWQYVASNKGATPSNYASGATADYNNATECQRVAWYSANSSSMTHDVGTKAANALGLYDMSGNVWEWCWDWYGDYPGTSTDYRGAGSGSYRIGRGGSCNSSSNTLRVGDRRHDYPYDGYNSYGFRIARSN